MGSTRSHKNNTKLNDQKPNVHMSQNVMSKRTSGVYFLAESEVEKKKMMKIRNEVKIINEQLFEWPQL